MIRSWLTRFLYRRQHSVRAYKTLNVITLDRSAALHNIDVFRRRHPGQAIMPVLKANAYGHGLSEMADILNGAECEFLVVDGYFEAARIRHISKHPILVLGYILPENVKLLDTKRCSFVVQDVAGLEAFGKLGRHVRVHMELNTGMNRLGLQPEEIKAYLEVLGKYPKIELEGVMTHLADADNEVDDAFTRAQVAQFDAQIEQLFAAGLRPRFVHVAQTAGSTKAQSKYANGVRVGIGLYGINPLMPSDTHFQDLKDLRAVLELTSTIVKVINLKPGDRVSYNGTFTAKHAMRVGVLPLGYYEGVSRELSNTGVVSHGDQLLPIVGKVCMNHTMVDLGETGLKVGDKVTVISRDATMPNSIAVLRIKHGLYGIFTGLSSTIRRKIV